MTRTVIVGTPNRFTKIRLRDLPGDKNLDFSFWRYVDLSGLDLRDYSMENVDLINYRARGTALPRAQYSQFRFPTDNTSLTPHPHTSSYSHDLVAVIFEQSSNLTDPIVARIYAYLLTGYDVSWRDGIQHLIDSGHTLSEIETSVMTAFTGYPKMKSRLRVHIRNISHTKIRERAQDLTKFEVPGTAGKVINLTASIPPNSFDRWAVARDLEQKFKLNHGAPSKVRVWLAQLHPYPIVLTSRSSTDDEFWLGWEWHG